jgi:hypothetical protein
MTIVEIIAYIKLYLVQFEYPPHFSEQWWIQHNVSSLKIIIFIHVHMNDFVIVIKKMR